jgi:hypothetical protein
VRRLNRKPYVCCLCNGPFPEFRRGLFCGVAYAAFAVDHSGTAGRDIYLVLDDFGARIGRAWREADEGKTDRATVLRGLMEGQYNAPVRVVAFNTTAGWSRLPKLVFLVISETHVADLFSQTNGA